MQNLKWAQEMMIYSLSLLDVTWKDQSYGIRNFSVWMYSHVGS